MRKGVNRRRRVFVNIFSGKRKDFTLLERTLTRKVSVTDVNLEERSICKTRKMIFKIR